MNCCSPLALPAPSTPGRQRAVLDHPLPGPVAHVPPHRQRPHRQRAPQRGALQVGRADARLGGESQAVGAPPPLARRPCTPAPLSRCLCLCALPCAAWLMTHMPLNPVNPKLDHLVLLYGLLCRWRLLQPLHAPATLPPLAVGARGRRAARGGRRYCRREGSPGLPRWPPAAAWGFTGGPAPPTTDPIPPLAPAGSPCPPCSWPSSSASCPACSPTLAPAASWWPTRCCATAAGRWRCSRASRSTSCPFTLRRCGRPAGQSGGGLGQSGGSPGKF
jgi:hypothetical protein